jgi:hypothetical protein
MRHAVRRSVTGLIAPRALGALALAAAAASAVNAAQVTDTRPVAPGQTIHLRVDAGAVTVRAGEPGIVAAAVDLAPGQALRWREAADRVVLVIDDRERLTPRAAALTLNVPADAPLVLRLGDASLDLQGVGGERLVVRGGRGDLRVAAASPMIDLETGNGAIEATVAGGRLRSVSVAGAQRLTAGGATRIDAGTVGGELGVQAAAPLRGRLSSVSGPIAVRLATTEALDLRAESLSGRIDARLPAGQGVQVSIAQARGDVTLPGGVTALAEGGVRVGEGGGRLALATFSGDIDVAVPADAEAPAPAANASSAPVPRP